MAENDIIGAIKIKDGLFIGDEFAAQVSTPAVLTRAGPRIRGRKQGLTSSKLRRPVNTEPLGAHRSLVPHLLLGRSGEPGTRTFSPNRHTRPLQVLFDGKDQTTEEIFRFVDEALEKTESVLVHSVRGQSRSSCVIASYLMRKFRWTLLKTLEFLNSRRPELEIRASFIHQLSAFENRLIKKGLGPKTSKWAGKLRASPSQTSATRIGTSRTKSCFCVTPSSTRRWAR